VVGDGIEHVQTTRRGQVWTGYFDEGIFGNFGWRDPIGAKGLLCWSSHGKRLYEFHPPAGANPMADCYALNVVSETAVWTCYYTDFPLVRIEDMRDASCWQGAPPGTSAFAVFGDRVLFRGGYDARSELVLCRLLEDGAMAVERRLKPTGPDGSELGEARATGRGPFLYFFVGPSMLRIDVRRL
jgi:hypothetical protein